MSEDYELNAEPGEYLVEGAPIGARSVERVLDEVRLALLSLLLSIGLTVGFGVAGGWGVGVGVVAGVAATLGAAAVLRWWHRPLARLMHWLLGR